MKPRFSRVTGLVLIIAALLGLGFSLAGLVFLGRFSSQVSASLAGTLDSLSEALTITQDGLDVADGALQDADSALISMTGTLDGVNQSLRGMDPTLDALRSLLGTDLPATIEATQDSLASAETSAKNIDGVLTSLSRIPFLGSLVYNPEVPLNETLAGISDSLDPIPGSLRQAKRGLDTAKTNLDTINTDLDVVVESTGEISTSTAEAQRVVSEYQTLVTSIQKRVEKMQKQLPGQVRLATLAAAIFLIWLGLAQIGLLTQGMEILSRAKNSDARTVIE